MPDTTEIIEWATSAGRIELEDGRYAVVERGDELLVTISEDGESVAFLEHYPKVVH